MFVQNIVVNSLKLYMLLIYTRQFKTGAKGARYPTGI